MKKEFLYIITAGILWGTSGIFVNLLAPFGFTSLQMVAMRGGVSFLCILLYALICKRSLFRISPKMLLLCALIGLSLFGTASAYYASMQLTTIATAVMLMYMAPVYVLIFSVIFFGERLSPKKLGALACVLLGCCFVSGIIGDFEANLVGVLLGLLSGVCYAAYNVFTKIAVQKKTSALQINLYAFLFMALVAIAVCQPLDIAKNAAKEPLLTIPLMLGIGLMTFIAPYTLYTLAMRKLPAGTATALGVMEPLSATVFGILFFEEKMTVLLAIGILLVLLGVVLLGSNAQKE